MKYLKEDYIPKGTCPRCGKPYTGRPALSRKDNITMICPDCGTREALDSIGLDKMEQEEIITIIHRFTERKNKNL